MTFTDYAGRHVSKTSQRVLWDPIAAEKGGHKHFMLKEIFEQPAAARDTILGRVSLDRGEIFLEDLHIPVETLAAAQKVTVLACGTSWHAGLVGKYLIESLAGLPVEVDYGSEYRYRDPIVGKNELVVVITQSGETADTLAALREARKKGATASRSATWSAAWPLASPTAPSTRTPGPRSGSPRPRPSRRSWWR